LTLNFPVQRPSGMLRMSKFAPGEFVTRAIHGPCPHFVRVAARTKSASCRFVRPWPPFQISMLGRYPSDEVLAKCPFGAKIPTASTEMVRVQRQIAASVRLFHSSPAYDALSASGGSGELTIRVSRKFWRSTHNSVHWTIQLFLLYARNKPDTIAFIRPRQSQPE
jgi:hypothetical protein